MEYAISPVPLSRELMNPSNKSLFQLFNYSIQF